MSLRERLEHRAGGRRAAAIDADYAGRCVARITEVQPAAEIVRSLAGG